MNAEQNYGMKHSPTERVGEELVRSLFGAGYQMSLALCLLFSLCISLLLASLFFHVPRLTWHEPISGVLEPTRAS